MEKTKVLAIASLGGHWVELLRLKPAFDGMELVYVSTNIGCSAMIEGNKFYTVTDASRWNKFKLLLCFAQVLKIVRKEKPQVVITTGAAPGLMGIIAGKMLGVKTVWVDCIANVDELSMSGKIALKYASRVYTQWPELADGAKIIYEGSVLS
jgi:UDP-N-acetylglucosamine:LPS N-acetylglucosamine transferase